MLPVVSIEPTFEKEDGRERGIVYVLKKGREVKGKEVEVGCCLVLIEDLSKREGGEFILGAWWLVGLFDGM